jgi:ABC-2 type transport system permease protein
LGFAPGETRESYTLAVSVQGVFESYFKGRPAPLEASGGTDESEASVGAPAASTIEVSPETSRLVVIGSGEFVDDLVFRISSSVAGDRYRNSLQLMQNAVDWSVEDLELLDIRARGTHARVLRPMEESEQSFWEGINYALALLALIGFGVVWNVQRRNELPLIEVTGSSRETHANFKKENEG